MSCSKWYVQCMCVHSCIRTHMYTDPCNVYMQYHGTKYTTVSVECGSLSCSHNNQACICFYQTTNSMWLSHLMCVQTVDSGVMSMGKPQWVHPLMNSFIWNVTMSMLGKMMQSLLFGCTIFRHESTSDTDPSA